MEIWPIHQAGSNSEFRLPYLPDIYCQLFYFHNFRMRHTVPEVSGLKDFIGRTDDALQGSAINTIQAHPYSRDKLLKTSSRCEDAYADRRRAGGGSPAM